MTNQPEALRVAQALELDWRVNLASNRDAIRLLREQHAEIERLKIERDALLEALKLARPYINPYTLDGYHAEIKADTAIAKSEKELEL